MKRTSSTQVLFLRLFMRVILLAYLIYIGASAGAAWFRAVRTKGFHDTQGKIVSVIPTIVGRTGPDRFPERTIYTYEIKVEYQAFGSKHVGGPIQYDEYYPYDVGEIVTVLYDPTNVVNFELMAPIHPISFTNIMLLIGLLVIYMLTEIQTHRIMKRKLVGGISKA